MQILSGIVYLNDIMSVTKLIDTILIKNNWNKIVPEFRDHNSFYSHTGERQIIYNATT